MSPARLTVTINNKEGQSESMQVLESPNGIPAIIDTPIGQAAAEGISFEQRKSTGGWEKSFDELRTEFPLDSSILCSNQEPIKDLELKRRQKYQHLDRDGHIHEITIEAEYIPQNSNPERLTC